MIEKLVEHPRYHQPTEIKAVLNGVASQEGNDGPDYDLMVEAADYINELESSVYFFKSAHLHVFGVDLSKKDSLFSYVNIVTPGAEGWLNLFFGEYCICMVDNVYIANQIRSVFQPKPSQYNTSNIELEKINEDGVG